MSDTVFVKAILKWYKINKRDLPWRSTRDPYFIWLSEVILQQTRVSQGLPYYYKFIKTFPKIEALSRASEQQVLTLWQGLGYYSRARNLHSSAKALVEHNNGVLPDSYEGLLKVKGIGPYTAAAIASFSYKERVPVVDGNVLRVLSRVFGIEADISSSKGIKEFYQMAYKVIPEKDPDIYNQAIMEFGALQCIPGKPDCEHCPVESICFAKRHNIQSSLPFKSKSVKKRTRFLNYLCYFYKDSFLLRERKEKDIWQGLYEFPLLESKNLFKESDIKDLLKDNNSLIHKSSKDYKHLLTHQTLFARFWIIEIKEQKQFNKLLKINNSDKFSVKQIKNLPKPVLINKFLEDYIFT